MSSSRPAEPARRPRAGTPRWRVRPIGRWSLRARVLAVLVGLLALVCLLVGAVTALALHQFQIGQLDARLTAAGGRFRAAEPPDREPRPPDGELARIFPPGQGPGTLSARVVGGQLDRAAVLDTSAGYARIREVPADQAPVLAALPADGRPRTRDLGTLGGYRLVASPTPSGDVLVTGLPLAEVNAAMYRLIVLEIALGAAALLVAGLSGAWILRPALGPLNRMAATAARVAELPLHTGEVALAERVPAADADPGTEVGRVGRALNRMLEHVAAALGARHASETRLRQFVADASHELRTPLAAIRGYTELARRRRASLPEDVGRALDGVESAAGRMTTLVEDLLLLARLDAGRPLHRQPVDLSALLIEAVSDAHAAAPGHRWHLDLPAEPVVVTGDVAGLHQVVGNILANAWTHTPAGTEVTVSLSPGAGPGRDGTAGPDSAPGGATIRVRDRGPGIPPTLLPHIFERFARGDTSRSRVAGSSGLGLAIVQAVVAAHHGEVDVSSGPGETVFTVRLPAG